jgi:hypothetical protein
MKEKHGYAPDKYGVWSRFEVTALARRVPEGREENLRQPADFQGNRVKEPSQD